MTSNQELVEQAASAPKELWNDPAGWVDHLIGDGKRDNIIVPMSVALELQALLRACPEPGTPRKCHANMHSDPPQDCDAPFCGCNPAWDDCIKMLQECNLLIDRNAPRTAEPPERAVGDRTRGLYSKFVVTRTDGKSEPGQKHHDCQYFVLDLDHDPHARAALTAYMKSAEAEYPLLAADIRALLYGCAFGGTPTAELGCTATETSALRLGHVFELRCANGHVHPKDTTARSCHCGLDICRAAVNGGDATLQRSPRAAAMADRITCQHDPLKPNCSMIIESGIMSRRIRCRACDVAAVAKSDGTFRCSPHTPPIQRCPHGYALENLRDGTDTCAGCTATETSDG